MRGSSVEIHLDHVQPLPLDGTDSNEMSASEVSSRGRPEGGSGDAVKIWNHRGRRIICAPRGLPLPESSEAQLPHLVANRSLKALISESSTARIRSPSTHLAAACRSVTDS
jgi:hypothetical protein